jgi:hypothetical protein
LDKFNDVFGRDLRSERDVTEYGLSRVACLCLGCPFFGKPLGRRATTKTGVPRISDALHNHLQHLPCVPGYHHDRRHVGIFLHGGACFQSAECPKDSTGFTWIMDRVREQPHLELTWAQMVQAWPARGAAAAELVPSP